MLSKRLVKELNQQISREFYASNLYRQMSAWCAYKGFPGCAGFLHRQAVEETEHMERLFKYVIETGALAVVGTIKAPQEDFTSLEAVFKSTYQHECEVTKHINALVEAALEEKDYSTVNFLQWYVAEQHEEESLFKSILDKFKIIGTDGRGLFFIDKEIGGLAVKKTD